MTATVKHVRPKYFCVGSKRFRAALKRFDAARECFAVISKRLGAAQKHNWVTSKRLGLTRLFFRITQNVFFLVMLRP